MKTMLRLALMAIGLLIFSPMMAATYYVSYVTGNDLNAGTIGAPFKTISKAVTTAVAGDIIYLRGETHVYTTTISLNKTGSSAARFQLLAYPSDATRPLIDFSGMAVASSARGFQLSGNYWTVKGIDVYKAGDNGMHISGGNNIVEFCSFFENYDTGLQLSNGANNNQIINCDSYFNRDLSDGNADGFAPKLDVGTGNSFKGCRAWQNSDDGWDGLLTAGGGTNPSTTYDSCWCFLNGYLKTGVASAGNGNGFKMGGNNELHDVVMRNCLSVHNRVKGFDQNNNNGSMVLYNNTGYMNAPNYGMNNNAPSAGKVMVLTNNVSFSNRTSANNAINAAATQTTNSWQSPFVVSAADFTSLDTSVLRGPRNADGSLPAISFMHLAQGSDLIDGGTNVGLAFIGSAPDLGYYESNYTLPVNLLWFNGRRAGSQNELQWRTAQETNNKGWEIERLIPGSIAWQKIGFVAGGGNSVMPLQYQFTDVQTNGHPILQYRLKQIDIDGNFKYSPVVQVKADAGSQVVLSTYPNPAQRQTAISFSLPLATTVQLDLIDQQGKTAKTIGREKLQAGAYVRPVQLDHLPAGTYFLRLITDGGITQTTRLVKQ